MLLSFETRALAALSVAFLAIYKQSSLHTRKKSEFAKACPVDSLLEFKDAPKSPAVFGNFFQFVKFLQFCKQNFQSTV